METFNLILLIVCVVFVNGELCPKQCDCDMDDGLNRATCTDQNIVSVDIGVPKDVQVYSLHNNVISELDNYIFKDTGYISLIVLNLSYNHIFWIGLHAFSGLIKLQHLNLSNNRLNYIPSDLFWETPQLEHLDLSGNIFETIKNEPFLMHQKLQMLNLRNCKMKALPVRMFTRLPNLRKLDLSENYMVSMKLELLIPLKKLNRIELESDYWRCTSEFMSIESWILTRDIVYRKQCKKMLSKMSEKMISVVANETVEVDVADVWNITNVHKNITKPTNTKRNLTTFERFDTEFPASQAFILGLEIGLAVGILCTYICIRRVCKCRWMNCRRPKTRRQELRLQRIAESDLMSSLLWANSNNPDLETPPQLRRQVSLPDLNFQPPLYYGLHSITEASDLFDVIMPGQEPNRSETPPPPYNECSVHGRNV